MLHNQINSPSGRLNFDKESVKKDEVNWETTSSYISSASRVMFGDNTDTNKLLVSIEHPNGKSWLNYKLMFNEEPFKPKIKYNISEVNWRVGNLQVYFQIFDGGLKETITLHDKTADLSSFKFSLKMPKSQRLILADGAIQVLDEELKEVFYLEQPTATDALGRDIPIEFKASNHELSSDIYSYVYLGFVADLTSYRYPIIIDPTTHVTISSSQSYSFNRFSSAFHSRKRDALTIIAPNSSSTYRLESFDDGVTWVATNLNFALGAIDDDLHASAMSPVDDKIYIFYINTSNNLVVRNSDDGFSTVSTIDNVVDRNPQDGRNLSAVCESDGTAHIFYNFKVGGFLNIFHASSDSWLAVDTITNVTADQGYIGCCVTNNDTPYVSWAGIWNSSVRTQVQLASDTFTTVTSVTADTNYHSTQTSVICDDSGVIYVAYAQKYKSTGGGLGEWHIVVKDSSDGFTAIDRIDNSDTWAKNWPQLALRKNTSPDVKLVSYLGRDATYASNDNLFYAYNSGFGFTSGYNATNTTTEIQALTVLRGYDASTNDPALIYRYGTVNTIFLKPNGFSVYNAGTVASDTEACDPFDTKAPIASTAINITSGAPTTGDTRVTLNVAWTESHPNKNIFGISFNGSTWDTAAGDTNTSTPSNKVIGTATVMDGNDIIYFRCVHTDDYDNTATSQDTTGITPVAPAAPTLSNANYGTFDVVVNHASADSAANLQYAIHVAGGASDSWVQAGGALGNTATWATKSGWGTKTVTGLVSNTSYSVYARGRNPNSTNKVSANGSTSSITTLSYDPTIADLSVSVPSDGSKHYGVTFVADDSDSATGSFTMSYYDGSTWNDISTIIGSTSVTFPETVGVIWGAGTDANSTVINAVKIKVTLVDIEGSDTSSESAPFILDTKEPYFPASVISMDTSSLQSNQVTLGWDSEVNEEHFSQYKLFISTISPEDAYDKHGVAWDSSDDINLATKSTLNTTITNLIQLTTYHVALFAYDTYGLCSIKKITKSFTTPEKKYFSGYVFDNNGYNVGLVRVGVYNATTGMLINDTTTNTRGFYELEAYSSGPFMLIAYTDGYESGVLDDIPGYSSLSSRNNTYNFSLDGTWSKSPANSADIILGGFKDDSEAIAAIYTSPNIQNNYTEIEVSLRYAVTELRHTCQVEEVRKAFRMIS